VYWLAEDEDSGAVIGSVMGLNHQKAFNDPEHGSSLWCLAVDPHCSRPGVGEVLVRHLIEHFMSRGLSYLDLSVLHDNRQAKNLYAKLGFRNLSTFAIKRKNGINQPLFLGPGPEAPFNPMRGSSSRKPIGAASTCKWMTPMPGCSPSAMAGAGCVAASRSAT
jgi:ribosomal protein S18 acetylase RimI-like enzyme